MKRVPASQKMRKDFEEVINGTSMSFDQQKAISDLQGESYVIGDEEGESYEDIG